MRLIPFLFVLLMSCTKEGITPDCSLGSIEVRDGNVTFDLIPRDTLWATFEHEEYGIVPVKWIWGEVDWDCIGFSRRKNSFTVTISDKYETCTFIIPALEQ